MTIQENAFELQHHLQLNMVYIKNTFQSYLKYILDLKRDNLHHGSSESQALEAIYRKLEEISKCPRTH